MSPDLRLSSLDSEAAEDDNVNVFKGDTYHDV